MLKNIPLGIENYLEANDKYYVDKTLIIKDIINTCIGRPLLITRPRRFGKSLTVSMLDYFFNNKGDYSYAFKDKKIMQYPNCLNYLNQHPVIHINMKDVSRDNYDDLMNITLKTISSIYREFNLVDFDFDFEKNEYLSIANKIYTNPFDYVDSIKFLSTLLYKKYNKKVVILIDEYDTPLEIAYQNGYYDKAIDFFKRFYSATLKSNDNILFSFTTGVLQIGKESIFSELNNLNTFDVTNNTFQEYFGFTKEETCSILKYFNVNFDINLVSKYYGGYGCNELEIFNPWSILNLIENEVFDSYWVNTSSNKTISNLIKDIPGSKQCLNDFINNDNLTFRFNNSLSYNDITNNYETLFSYLLQAGYVVGKRKDNTPYYNLYIPNLELKEVFAKELIDRNFNEYFVNIANNFRDSLLSGNVESITNFLSKFINESFSYYDLNKEKDFQILISTLLYVFFTDYQIKTEVNNRNGRCDIMMIPKNHSNIGIIIELKSFNSRLTNSLLKEKADAAISQILNNSYYSELQSLNIKHILLYGFAFDKTKNAISSKEIIS